MQALGNSSGVVSLVLRSGMTATHPDWLTPACNYIASWLGLQLRLSEQPGCIVAVLHGDEPVLETAFGHANLSTRETLTPRHRFRVASHSKSFTAAGIMALREAGRLRLDDPVGTHLTGLHPEVARVTLAQILSHTGGLRRDAPDAGYFQDRRPSPAAEEVLSDLNAPPTISPNTRFKYSNHGYALLGLVTEAITGAPYRDWITQTVLEPAGLTETTPDMPLPVGIPFARGHSSKALLGHRLVIPGDQTLNATAPAGGFVSTARDLARFYAQLSPEAERSMLSVESRREMTRRQWRNPHASLERWYGLGTMSGSFEGWNWFGHGGGLQGYISQTCMIPERALTVSALTNAIDGWAGYWLEGTVHILRAFATRGVSDASLADWTGRWWSLWGVVDLVPMGNRVLVAGARMGKPFQDTSEIEMTEPDRGRIVAANGYESYHEDARLVRTDGSVSEIFLGGTRLLPETAVAEEVAARYAAVSEAQTRG